MLSVLWIWAPASLVRHVASTFAVKSFMGLRSLFNTTDFNQQPSSRATYYLQQKFRLLPHLIFQLYAWRLLLEYTNTAAARPALAHLSKWYAFPAFECRARPTPRSSAAYGRDGLTLAYVLIDLSVGWFSDRRASLRIQGSFLSVRKSPSNPESCRMKVGRLANGIWSWHSTGVIGQGRRWLVLKFPF